MPRPKRIEFENAWYHVMNRVSCRKTLYFSEYHYALFIDLLKESATKYSVEVHGYCLMKNHYHLLICTPKGNLSKFMQHFMSRFVQIVNLHNNADGSLFKDRYKALIVDSEKYLLQVSRYIHLNPVESEYVRFPEQYRWSSYSIFIEDQPSFVKRETILDYFKNSTEYRSFVNHGIDDEMRCFYTKNNSSILGSDTFIQSIKQRYLKKT